MWSRIMILAAICVGFSLSAAAVNLQAESIANFLLHILNEDSSIPKEEIRVFNFTGKTPDNQNCKVLIAGNHEDAKITIWTFDFQPISAHVNVGTKYNSVYTRQDTNAKLIQFSHSDRYEDYADQVFVETSADGSPSITIENKIDGAKGIVLFFNNKSQTCKDLKPLVRPNI